MGWGLVLNLANSILLLSSLFSLPFISHFQNVQRQSQLHVVISISYMQILKKCLLRNKSGWGGGGPVDTVYITLVPVHLTYDTINIHVYKFHRKVK